MKYKTYVKYRDKAKMNDRAVAIKIGIFPQNISTWKNGMTLNMDRQLKIAKLLNIPDKVVLHDI